MQLSFRHKEQLFHELAQLVQSGLPFPKALEILARNQRGRTGRVIHLLLRSWEGTHTAAGALAGAGFASRDVSLVAAGEASGRLDEIFTELSTYYAQLAMTKRDLVAKSLYPVIVLHLGIILMAIPPAIASGGFPGFIKTAVPVLAGLYLLAGIILLVGIFLLRQLAVNQTTARLLLGLPVIGGFIRNWTGWNFALVLSLHVRAGGSLLESFRRAAEACGNAALAAATDRAMDKVRRGSGLAEAFQGNQNAVPEVLLRAWEVGEQAGRLDEEASRAANFLNQRVLLQFNLIATWLPRFLYLLVVLITAWQIIQMFQAMGGEIDRAIAPE